jgi:hypothetical protein
MRLHLRRRRARKAADAERHREGAVTKDTITAAAVKAKAEVLVAEIRTNLGRLNTLIVDADEDDDLDLRDPPDFGKADDV